MQYILNRLDQDDHDQEALLCFMLAHASDPKCATPGPRRFENVIMQRDGWWPAFTKTIINH